MRRPVWAFCVEALLLLLVLPRAAGGTTFSRRRSLQVLTDGETVLNGVLNLFTEEGVAACEGSCKGAFATAFGIDEVSVGCVCPMSTSASDADRRRNLMGDGKQPTSNSAEQNNGSSDRRSLRGQRRRWLAETNSSEPVAFSARVAGGLAGGAAALDLLSESGWSAVASAFGVDGDELEISTLTVTPPASTNSTETLEVITDFFDASDISIVSSMSTTEGTDWAGGGRGVALFLAMFVLLVMTFCCCGFLAGLLLWKAQKHGGGAVGAEKFFKSHLPERNSFRWGEQPTADGNPRRSEPHSSEGASPNGPLLGLVDAQDSSNRSPSRESVSHEGDEAAGGGVDHRKATSTSSAAVAPESSSKSRGVSGGDLGKELESPGAAGRGGVTQQTAAAAAAAAAAAPAATAGGRDEESAIPRNVSMEESVGTNPLYKTAAPYSRSTNESQSEQTPGRSRFSTFLGNATPSRLRRLAGRVAKSPALSASSRRSKPSSASRHSRSGGSSTRSRRHRRQGSFPGAYSQRNSSELDHQRPPADPVYTFMIKTIAAKGFKFMTTTEIAFCAMRMYSHFRRTEGNYKRLTVMQNAENVPPVYEIIWQCDGTSEGNPEGESRFFSSTSGTDAEQQKSLLACLLALSWDGSTSSRKTLQRALTPTRPSKVPLPEDIFWDEFKDSTDALSGDDEMVVVARMVLLVAESANKPGQDGVSSGASSSGVPPGATAGGGEKREKEGIEHGDIMQALSGAHLREIGIAIKEARPGWQEAHVQLVSVLLVMAYLEEGAKNTLPGGDRPDPLSSLEWVNLLTAEALDAFLVEKLEARRALVELDLEPSGLVIRHDDHGVVERVEPAVEEKKTSSWMPSRGHQQILPKSSSRSRKGRGHRRSRSVESASSTGSKPSPVVITTVHGRKDKKSGGAAGGTSTSSAASADSSFKAGGGDRSSLRTVSQQRPRRSSSEKSSSAAGDGGGGGDNIPPKLTIDAGDFAVRVPVKGTSVRSELSRGLSPAGSQASSVVTRVYAPSSVGGGDQARSPDVAQTFASPTNESAMSQVSIAASRFLSSPVNNRFGPQFRGQSASSGLTGVSAGTAAGSGSGVVPVGVARKDMGFSQDLSGLTPTRTARGGEDGARSPGAFSVAGRSEAGFSDAASRYDNSFAASRESGVSLAGRVGLTAGTGGGGGSGPPTRLDGLEIQQPSSPNSAAASRFDTSSPASATTFTSRVGVGSPTAAPAGAGGRTRVGAGGPLTGRSAASSMRSDGGSSFFRASGGSQRSGDSRGIGGAGSASASSWDDEDLQNMGTRWLADRAYNQQFDAQK